MITLGLPCLPQAEPKVNDIEPKKWDRSLRSHFNSKLIYLIYLRTINVTRRLFARTKSSSSFSFVS